MREREPFADVLDRAIGGSPNPGRPNLRQPGPPPEAFRCVPPWYPSGEPRPAANSAWRAYGVQPSVGQPRRSPGRLSPAERLAAEELRRLGASLLGDDFSQADVKHAYRVLARRFHPDAHPGASDAELAYLADAFGRITAAYHQLTASSATLCR